jgi:hypothetical protein
MPVFREKFGTKKFGTFKFGAGVNIITTIAGVDVNPDDIYISDVLNAEVNTLECVIYGAYSARPLCGQEIIMTHLEDTSVRVTVFGGRITNVKPFKLNNTYFRFEISASDYTASLDKLLVKETYTGNTINEIISDIITNYTTGFTITGVESPGPTIDKIQFNYKPVSECIQTLADYTGYDWFVDYAKDIKFFSLDTSITNAPIELLDGGTQFDALELNYDNTQIRNKVIVRGGYYLSSPYTQDAITAIAGQKEFNLAYKPSNLTVTINGGAPETVGIEFIDAAGGHAFLLNYNEKLLKADTATFTGGEIVAITYKYEIPVIVNLEDGDSQTALAAIEGGTGIHEHIIFDNNITDLDAARQRAEGELLQFANPIIDGSFITLKDGFRSGQKIHIDLSDRSIDAYYLIKQVDFEMQGGEFFYTVTFATYLLGFSWLLIKLLDATRPKKDIDNEEVLDMIENVAETIGAITDGTSYVQSAIPYLWADDSGGPVDRRAVWDESQWAPD